MLKSDIAVVLALCAALASAIGAVSRQQSAHEVTDEPVGHWELFRMSLRDARWWLGGGGAVANYSLQAAALGVGSVMLVTALQVTALLFALPVNARLTRSAGDPLAVDVGDGARRRFGGGRHGWRPEGRAVAGVADNLDCGGPGVGSATGVLCPGCAHLARSACGCTAGGGGRFVAGPVRGANQSRRRGGRTWFRGAAVRAGVLCLDTGGVGRDDLSAVIVSRWCADRLNAVGDRGQTSGGIGSGHRGARRDPQRRWRGHDRPGVGGDSGDCRDSGSSPRRGPYSGAQ